MKVVRSKSYSVYRGSGLLSSISALPGKILNRSIDLLPIELHVPGYQYCGPGTRLQQRLNRNDPGINKLDQACKEHDIAYSKYSDSNQRAIADKQLADKAWQRVTSSDASLGERATAYAVTNIMKVKNKLGGGKTNKKKKDKKRKRACKAVKKVLVKAIRRIKKNCSKSKKKKKGTGYYLKPYKGGGSKKKN